MVAFIQGPSEAVAGHLSGDLLDVDPKGSASVIGETPKNIAVNANSAMPELTKVPIPVGTGYTVPAGHSLGVRIRLSFVGTSAHTLYYDSDKFPSGVSLQTGQVVTHEDCPKVIGGPAPVSGGDQPKETTTTTTTAPSPLPALPGALPALPALHDLPALDQVGQKGLELVPQVGPVQGQLDRGPQKVDLLPDVVAPGLEGVTEDRLRL